MRKIETVKMAARLIKEGKVIICPTDTVYGLICDATNKKAIKKLFQIKKRPSNKPIPIFVKDIKMAKKFAIVNKRQEEFLKKVWPGKATVILKKKKRGPEIFFGGKETIGLRIPKHKFVNQLLAAVNRPLSGTSANISSQPHSTKIREIIKQFENKKFQPDLIIDSGNLKPSKPSTTLDLTGLKIKILREGAISKKELIKKFQ